MVAGTTIMRTMVASMNTAAAKQEDLVVHRQTEKCTGVPVLESEAGGLHVTQGPIPQMVESVSLCDRNITNITNT
jgi:hypothetical protein